MRNDPPQGETIGFNMPMIKHFTLVALAFLGTMDFVDAAPDNRAKYGGCFNEPDTVKEIAKYQDPGDTLDSTIKFYENYVVKMNAYLAKTRALRNDAAYYAANRDAIEKEISGIGDTLAQREKMLVTFRRCKAKAADCRSVALNVLGSVPSQITPGSRTTINIGNPKDGTLVQAEISVAAAKTGVQVSGRIKNVGQACAIGTSQPIRLHPIATGLPISWHTVPEGIHANPTLRPGQQTTFSKTYSTDYKAGFNLRLGTYTAQD